MECIVKTKKCGKNPSVRYTDSVTLWAQFLHKGADNVRIVLDRKLIDNLRKMSDEGLWRLLYGFASGKDFSKKNPDYKRIRRIRAVLDAATDEDLLRINQLIEIYSNIK